jgi:hypothetical protein
MEAILPSETSVHTRSTRRHIPEEAFFIVTVVKTTNPTYRILVGKPEERKGGWKYYVGVVISLSNFLFAAQPKDFFLDGLKKSEQRSHKCVELRGEYVE